MYKLSDSDKHYLGALVVLMGVIFFWRGLWDITYIIPIIENPFVSLFIGLTVITLTGVVFKEFDPFAAKMQKTMEILNEIQSHSHNKQKNYTVKYYDEISKKHHIVPHHSIKKVEQNFIIIEEKGREKFIPIHRIREIHQHNKMLWKK